MQEMTDNYAENMDFGEDTPEVLEPPRLYSLEDAFPEFRWDEGNARRWQEEARLDAIAEYAGQRLVEMGANVRHDGFAALLCVTTQAAAEQLRGRNWSCIDLFRTYGEFRRIHWAVAWADAVACLGAARVDGTVKAIVVEVESLAAAEAVADAD